MRSCFRRATPFALALLCLSSAVAQTTAESAGKISAVVPATAVIRGDGKRASRLDAGAGTPLVWRDQLQTTKSGRARILLNDQSVLSLGTDSQLRILKHDARTQVTALELGYGRIRCQVSKITRAGGNFELRTPSAVAGVIGTDFGVDASMPGQTKYICISGTVRIYTPDRQHYVDCKEGETVTINEGELPSVTPATPYQIDRWQHVTEPSDGKFAETLNRAPDMSDQLPSGGLPQDSLPKASSPQWHGLTFSGNWRLRMEAWNWFADGPADNTYAFGHSILRLGLGKRGRNVDWQLELAQPTVFRAPANALAPAPQGQLGGGGTHYIANGRVRDSAYIFPSKAFLRIHGFGGEKNSLTLGRFVFVDGMEVVPRNPTLTWLQEKRIAHRLIGDFNFAVTGRSEDGALLSLDLGRTNVTAGGGRVTRGVYQVDGLGELDVAWQYGSVTVPFVTGRSAAELRVFGAGYQDFRALDKVDNRPAAARPINDRFQDINLGTFGFDYLHALHTRDAGIFDFMIWAAGQAGSWGPQSHRAGALAAEVGWQPRAGWRPWLRAGYFIGSGDGDPSDHRHHTFFPMLPTPRLYARFPFYNQQNNTDVSITLLLRPTSRVTLRSDGHNLSLTSRKDLWYLGGGAFQPRTFGFQGRPSGGFRGLANLWDLSADCNVSRHWAVNFYYAHAWTKAAIRSVYPNARGADFGYTELIFKF